jgi:pimeloyl-ACP methyl ester carboxylesterase
MTDVAFQVFMPPGGPRLHIDDRGGPGLPMLFQHGLCGDASQPAEVFPAGEAFRRITVECRGHGRSEAGRPADLSIARFAGDCAELLEFRQLPPLVVGGISMGAAIAMRLAVIRPDLVRGLVIARPAWGCEEAPPNMAPNAEVGQLLARMPPDEARATFARSDTARRLAAETPDNLVSLQGFFRREPLTVTAALLQKISADGPGVTRQQLAAIAVPTLVIAHRRDSVHPYSLAEDLARLIPGARLLEITAKADDRGRYVADFRAALTAFLKGFLP